MHQYVEHRIRVDVTNDSNECFECLDHVSRAHNYSLFKDTLPEPFSGPCLILNWIKVNGQIYRSRICIISNTGQESMLKYIKYINLMVLFIILALSHTYVSFRIFFYISFIKVGITPFKNGCLGHRNFEVPTIRMVHSHIPTLVPTPKLWLTQP